MQDPTLFPVENELNATAHGFPRIGLHRELKFACEAFWKHEIDAAQLQAIAADIRANNWMSMAKAGLTSVPCNDFSFYDSMLDTTIMLGAIPERFQALQPVSDDEQRLALYFAMARGTAEVEPLEMTKWFDTNYHYLVPEISPQTSFTLDLTKPLAELGEAVALGLCARPVLIGPATFLHLAKPTADSPEDFRPSDRLLELALLYVDAIAQLNRAGARWVQLDEPVLSLDLSDEELAQIQEVYNRIGSAIWRPELLVSTYFGHVGSAIELLRDLPVEAIGLDFTEAGAANLPLLKEACGFGDKILVAGVVNGRNIWRNDLASSLDLLFELESFAESVAVSSSCSLLHVPVDVTVESFDLQLQGCLAFAVQKVDEIVNLSIGLDNGPSAIEIELEQSAQVAQLRRELADRNRTELRELPSRRTSNFSTRAQLQQQRLNLPLLPTTTIGSFPQTRAVRAARAAWVKGAVGNEQYCEVMRAEVQQVIDLQLELGIDVLVHGEPERNDMVQYFAEQLDGFAATTNGWVQSYGSRCVRPPILFGDVSRRSPMTVEWARYAQSLTRQPVKGMLTGPVTILCWSFVRDDQPLRTTALQVAAALRDEVVDLEAAGIAVIQVDEPALREGLPLRLAEQADYLDWATESFRVATSSVRDDTSIHTHMCYAEFNDMLPAIIDLDVDVISFEAARSHLEIASQLRDADFSAGVGPGVYDIHSPRVPTQAEIEAKVRRILKSIPKEQVWINPDCGLKTRDVDEVQAALRNLVNAAIAVRGTLHD